jgi:hypothetical protein
MMTIERDHLEGEYLFARVSLLHAAAEQTHNGWGQRQQANDPEDRQQIVVNVWNSVAQPIAEGGHADGPEQTTENILKKKGAVVHISRTGDHRRQGPDKMEEARQNDGFSPVARIEVACSDAMRAQYPESGTVDCQEARSILQVISRT